MDSPIRKWRDAAGLNQDDVATLIKGHRGQAVQQTQVSYWERTCVMRLANAVMFERISDGAVTRQAIREFGAWWQKQEKKRKSKSRRAEKAAYQVSIRTGELQREVLLAASDGEIDETEAQRIAAKCEAVRASANEVESSSKDPG
jgi:hypothetical protein